MKVYNIKNFNITSLMNKIITIILLFFFSIGYSQSNKKLTAVFVTRGNEINFGVDLAADRLIELKDPVLNKKLLLHLKNKGKEIAIHYILTERLGDKKSQLIAHYVYDNNRKIVRINFSFNNFNWYQNYPNKDFIIDNYKLKKVIQYWKNKII
jgi:hypothetical protein